MSRNFRKKIVKSKSEKQNTFTKWCCFRPIFSEKIRNSQKCSWKRLANFVKPHVRCQILSIFRQFFRKLKNLTRYMWIDIISETFSGALLIVSDSFEKIGPQIIPIREGFLFFRSRFDNLFSNLSTVTVNY